MTKEDKGKKILSHERRRKHSFIKKKVEQEEPLGNGNMALPVGKKRKS